VISALSTDESRESHYEFDKVFFMSSTGICNYPHQTNIRKFTAWQHRGTKLLGTFGGLDSQTKLQSPN